MSNAARYARVAVLLHKQAREFSPWVAFDLDGTLAKKQEPFDPETVGEPIEKMIKVLKKHLADGDTCKIMTARASGDKRRATRVVQAWLEEQGLPKLDVVCEKNPGMTLIYDDRAVSVKTDVGTTKQAAAAYYRSKSANIASKDLRYWQEVNESTAKKLSKMSMEDQARAQFGSVTVIGACGHQIRQGDNGVIVEIGKKCFTCLKAGEATRST